MSFGPRVSSRKHGAFFILFKIVYFKSFIWANCVVACPRNTQVLLREAPSTSSQLNDLRLA